MSLFILYLLFTWLESTEQQVSLWFHLVWPATCVGKTVFKAIIWNDTLESSAVVLFFSVLRWYCHLAFLPELLYGDYINISDKLKTWKITGNVYKGFSIINTRTYASGLSSCVTYCFQRLSCSYIEIALQPWSTDRGALYRLNLSI